VFWLAIWTPKTHTDTHICHKTHPYVPYTAVHGTRPCTVPDLEYGPYRMHPYPYFRRPVSDPCRNGRCGALVGNRGS
jgi:hypothetical protein